VGGYVNQSGALRRRACAHQHRSVPVVRARSAHRGWHGPRYAPVWTKDCPVFHPRIDRAGGCVADPGEILSYRATSAFAGPLRV